MLEENDAHGLEVTSSPWMKRYWHLKECFKNQWFALREK